MVTKAIKKKIRWSKVYSSPDDHDLYIDGLDSLELVSREEAEKKIRRLARYDRERRELLECRIKKLQQSMTISLLGKTIWPRR